MEVASSCRPLLSHAQSASPRPQPVPSLLYFMCPFTTSYSAAAFAAGSAGSFLSAISVSGLPSIGTSRSGFSSRPTSGTSSLPVAAGRRATLYFVDSFTVPSASGVASMYQMWLPYSGSRFSLDVPGAFLSSTATVCSASVCGTGTQTRTVCPAGSPVTSAS